MIVLSQPLRLTLCLMAIVISTGGVCSGQAQNFELQELKTTLEASARQNSDLQSQLAAQKAQAQALAQSLSSANAESAASREGLEKLRGLLEGLGIGALEGGSNQIQERLLAALSDMRLLDDQKKKLADALMSLSEAALTYAKVTPSADDDAASKLTEAIGNAERVMRTASNTGTADAPATDLHNAKIVSVKPELNVAILNVGSRDGVKVGMPFAVFRDDRPVAKLLVVDVRKSVAGAVIQETNNTKDQVRIGDRGIIDTDRSF